MDVDVEEFVAEGGPWDGRHVWLSLPTRYLHVPEWTARGFVEHVYEVVPRETRDGETVTVRRALVYARS
jgi:hypothetical protein